MSSMELNKIFAAILLAGVIAMSTGLFARMLVSPQQLDQPAVVIDTGAEAPTADQEDEVIASVLPLLASADPDNGQTLSRACAACHSFDDGGGHGVGPNLWNVVGASKAARDFNYSNALEEFGGEWAYESLNHFLNRPRDYVPGTSMNYAGMGDVEDRADLIAWLRTLSDDPVDLPTEEEIAEAEAEMAGDEDDAEENGAVEGDGEAENGAAEDAAADTGEDTAADEAEGDTAGEDDAEAEAGDETED